jgi:energy-coupling factor transporter ATP-binding protein EcfA2
MDNTTSEEALVKWRVASTTQENLLVKIDSVTEFLKATEKKIENHVEAKQLLELLKNHKLEQRKDFILSVINRALLDIFESDYRLDIQPRETKGKSAASTQKYDIIFFQNGIEIARNEELLISNGGGVLSIASLFFKILIGYLYSKNKFYIFDEALSQVSPQYRGRLSRFLKEFCKQYDFTLVVVSQTEELEEHADLVYEVSSSTDKNNIPVLDIVSCTGETPTENYFYCGIENFQSIKKAEFIYKGFTIIRGPNNSGKSATLRAIQALLFNSFKVDSYPRKNPGGMKLITSVIFGYQGPKDEPSTEIRMIYRSSKVMFVIDGNEYYGKSLAADKLKEAVEKIGFRYIDIKSMYKNFKGPLKEQTERIAYTNQYDGLFLIGSKTTDSEKIFSFLFNTENIALAIAQVKEIIHELNKDFNSAQQDLINMQEEIKIVRLTTDKYLNIYYYKLINEYQEKSRLIFDVRSKAGIYKSLTESLHQFIDITTKSIFLVEANNTIQQLSNKNLHNNHCEVIVQKILSEIEETNTINKFLDLETTRQKYINTKNIFDAMIPNIQAIESFDYLFSLDARRQQFKDKQAKIFADIESLGNTYNLCECSSCSGLGVLPSSFD